MGLAKNSLITFAGQIIANLLQFILGVMTARFLGPEGKGLLYVLIVSLTICTELGSLGLGDASIYFIGKDRKRLAKTLGNLLVVTGVVSIVLLGLGSFFLRHSWPDIYAQFPFWVWAIVALLLPIHLLQMFVMRVLMAILCIKEISVVEVTRIIVQLLAFAVLVIVMGMGIEGAFLAYAFSAHFAAVSFLILVMYHGERPKGPDWPLLIASLRYGVKPYIANVLWHLAARLHVLLLANLAVNGAQAVGVYSVATTLAELVLFIPASITLSLFPMVSAASVVEANRLTPAACRHTLVLTILLAIGLGITGQFAVHRLYGELFDAATLPLMVLLPGVIMLSQAHVLFGDLNGRGKPGATAISTLGSLITALILDFLLIPKHGVIGAALAFSCASAVEFVMVGSFFVYHSGLSWRGLFAFQKSDFSWYLGLLPTIRKMFQPAH